MIPFLAHGSGVPRDPEEYVGSPLYAVIPEHQLAVWAIVALLATVWWLRRRHRRKGRTLPGWLDRFGMLEPIEALLVAMLAISGIVHIALVITHEPYFMSVGWLIAGAAFLYLARARLDGHRLRRTTIAILLGSILAFVIAAVAGEAPDEVAIATKLVELTALAVLVRPRHPGRLRRLVGTTSVVSLTVLVAAGGWIGAFAAGDGGHHLGEVPAPGVLLPPGEDRPATLAEQTEADHLYQATVAALAKYEDPAAAAAAGYAVEGMYGSDFHAGNAAYQSDGIILDPERPETLVYAMRPDGTAVLLGAMFEMEEIGEAGPAPGGPLTVWHAHDHICVSLTPPALASLTDPFGFCPFGTITVPITQEMLHVWTLPGVDEQFGDIDDAWLAEYLADDGGT